MPYEKLGKASKCMHSTRIFAKLFVSYVCICFFVYSYALVFAEELRKGLLLISDPTEMTKLPVHCLWFCEGLLVP